jgi:hypothetical protein
VFTTDRVTNVVALLSAPAVVDAAYMDVLLVGPNGNKVKLMGGAGQLATNRCALYVDLLELQDYATNVDEMGDLTEVQVNPNMRIYFAAAAEKFTSAIISISNDVYGNQYIVTNIVSVTNDISGTLGDPSANGGRFGWVPDYAGYFSKFSLGKTPNVTLSVTVSNGPAPSALVSWNSMANATNSLYFKTNPASANWQLLTNFISSPLGGMVTVADPISSSSPRFYRVRVDPKRP